MELQGSSDISINVPPPLPGFLDRLKRVREDRAFDSWQATFSPGEPVQPAEHSLKNLSSPGKNEFADREGSDYVAASDDQLLAAAKASDGRAFEVLSGRYVKSIRKRVHRIVRNSEDTQDVVQESLLKAYHHLPELKECYSFSKWFMTIAINTALMLIRRKKARPEISFDQHDANDQTWTMWNIPDRSPSTEQTYARQETLAFVSRAMNHLPPMFRIVLEQHHVHGKPLREVANMLGITVASAKSRLFRARRTLRSMLEEQELSMSNASY
jgi:RNA polymerase sigma-70 factor (ECF subfamily)